MAVDAHAEVFEANAIISGIIKLAQAADEEVGLDGFELSQILAPVEAKLKTALELMTQQPTQRVVGL